MARFCAFYRWCSPADYGRLTLPEHRALTDAMNVQQETAASIAALGGLGR